MKFNIYQIDAFATRNFEGNPAAVIPLDEWLTDQLMQSIAEENHLSETVFFVKTAKGFHIRWFTPRTEVKLCGHATLAASYVIFNLLGYSENTIVFESLSGELRVSKNNDLITLDFPRQQATPCEIPVELLNALNRPVTDCLAHEDIIAVLENEEALLTVEPNQSLLEKLNYRGVIITAPSTNYDFVARFFAPRHGIPEDPVTGSAYTQLMPYWSEKLGRTKLKAKQLSARGGELFCEIKNDRVFISGRAAYYMEGNIKLTL